MNETTQEQTHERNALDRLTDAIRGLDGQIELARERFDARVKRIQARVERTLHRSPFYERTRELREGLGHRREQLQKAIEDTTLFRRAHETQKRFEEQLAETRSQLLAMLGLVSRSDLEKLSARLEELAKRMRELAEQKPAA
jgi:hypothetical protein